MKICTISFHSCPYSSLGGNGSGGMSVYLRELTAGLVDFPDVRVDILTRAQDPVCAEAKDISPQIRVVQLKGGPEHPIDRKYLYEFIPEFSGNLEDYILSQAFSDIGLVKTNEKGVTQWNQTYGGLGWEDASALVQTVDGGFVLSGSTRSFGASSTNMWLVKTDASGVPQWNQTYGVLPWSPTSYYNWDTLLVQTADGGFALTGNTRSSGADSSSKMLLVKIDAKGIVQWNQTYGGANLEARITTGQGTPGLETLSLITALIVLIASEKIKQGKKRKRN